MTTPPLTVRAITPAEHLGFVRSQRSASFLQTPAWGTVKSEWRQESIGWFRGGVSTGSTGGEGSTGQELVGAGLVLYRRLPKLRKYLAYLPEGPLVDWHSDELAAWLEPMVAHLRAQGSFAVRMGPPVVTRRWDAAAVKAGVADESVTRLDDVPPTEREAAGARVQSQLRELGWREQTADGGFAAGQPKFNFQVPLAGRSEDDVLAAMNQQWRRNIKRADKSGVAVTHGTPADLKLFHDLYAHTAQRDGFTPRPLAYFQAMFDALLSEEPDRVRLYLAHHEDDLVAATVGVRVGGHTWYSYGASSTEKRDVRGSNAVQWAMIRDALGTGADVYDMRGITETLDEDDPHIGLIRFKVGTGGEAVEYVGEWDLPINSVVYKAFSLYMSRRG